MKIQYMSDLHLEYPENRQYFRDNPVEPLGDVLVLAGDIVCDQVREEAKDFFRDVESKFPFVISTMGNHEFYGGEITYAYPDYSRNLASNHLLLNNRTFITGNVRFIVSALWSAVDPQHRPEISRRLNDYRYIKKKINGTEEFITVDDTNYFHKISLEYISNELQKGFSGKTVVITHHVPSIECVNPKWRDSTLLSAFVCSLDQLIMENKIDCWIFGHQHEFVREKIGNTLMLSNPLGYHKEENFHLFKSDKVIEL